jgi:hypothetical protein
VLRYVVTLQVWSVLRYVVTLQVWSVLRYVVTVRGNVTVCTVLRYVVMSQCAPNFIRHGCHFGLCASGLRLKFSIHFSYLAAFQHAARRSVEFGAVMRLVVVYFVVHLVSSSHYFLFDRLSHHFVPKHCQPLEMGDTISDSHNTAGAAVLQCFT